MKLHPLSLSLAGSTSCSFCLSPGVLHASLWRWG